jgi:hypothetical protein
MHSRFMDAGRAPKDEIEIRSASVGMRIRPSLKAALQDLAQAEKRTLNYYIERMLEEHVNARRSAGETYLEKQDMVVLP